MTGAEPFLLNLMNTIYMYLNKLLSDFMFVHLVRKNTHCLSG